jgi:hypothetical protein
VFAKQQVCYDWHCDNDDSEKAGQKKIEDVTEGIKAWLSPAEHNSDTKV